MVYVIPEEAPPKDMVGLQVFFTYVDNVEVPELNEIPPEAYIAGPIFLGVCVDVFTVEDDPWKEIGLYCKVPAPVMAFVFVLTTSHSAIVTIVPVPIDIDEAVPEPKKQLVKFEVPDVTVVKQVLFPLLIWEKFMLLPTAVIVIGK